MKPQGIAGLVLILIGVVILFFQGLFSFTHKEQLAKVGPLEINGQKRETVFVPPVIGAVVLVGGIALLVLGARKA